MTKQERERVRDAIACFMGEIDDWQHGMSLLCSLIGGASRREVRVALRRVRQLRAKKREKT